MNCNTAQSTFEKIPEGTMAIAERLDLNSHLDLCTECREYCSELSKFVATASHWASDYTQISDPGESLDAKVMAAIAGRAPGRVVHYRRKCAWVYTAAAVSAVLSFVAGSYVTLPVSVIATVDGLQVTDRLPIAIVNWFNDLWHEAASAPLFTDTQILPTLAALMLLNLIIYSRPVRRILRAQ